LAFSEIEPFPRAVLAYHYPDVPLHGDFTVLRDQPWIVDADVLVGGTPCQAFSVAGLRNSLADERGNLSLEFVRLADAIDTIRSGRGREPGIIVWENVPGVLSVRDNAFGCFIAALAGDVEPYVPPRGKWTNAGVVDGPARQVAWRVLDAQYFGLAQRRRRVFVVASARAGFDPAAVLLEFEGLRRDTPPRREKGQAASGGATSRAKERSHWDGDFPHPTLNQSHNTGGVGQSNQELFSQRGAYLAPSKWPADIAPTLNAHFGEKQGLEDQHALGGAGLFVPDISPCLETQVGGLRQPCTQAYVVTPPLTASMASPLGNGGKDDFITAISFHPTQDPISSIDGSTHSLGCGSKGGLATIGICTNMAVRRLTPTECERLQGFPNGYTMIPWKKKPADQCPDGPRYKALGNSMAVPCMHWIGHRIKIHLNRQ
jgi:DNA (cytosine-5)-methyltransferase 1